jgi:aminotransferase
MSAAEQHVVGCPLPASDVDLTESMMRVHQYIMMSAPTMAQYAALEALRNGEEDVRGMVGEYDRRRKLMVRELNAMGLTCFEPRGAFYCFLCALDRPVGRSVLEAVTEEKAAGAGPPSAVRRGHVRSVHGALRGAGGGVERIRRFVGRHQPSAK